MLSKKAGFICGVIIALNLTACSVGSKEAPTNDTLEAEVQEYISAVMSENAKITYFAVDESEEGQDGNEFQADCVVTYCDDSMKYVDLFTLEYTFDHGEWELQKIHIDTDYAERVQVPLGYEGHYYEIFDVENVLTWEDAETYCESVGGHLATVTSEGENEYLYQLFNKSGYTSVYFGLSDAAEEGTWVWVTGEEYDFSDWHTGEPNQYEGRLENYAQFNYDVDGYWNDNDFNLENEDGTAFVCEWDSESAYLNYQQQEKNSG